MDISIIIINYKTRELTLNCIESVIYSKTKYNYEIILIDNASYDGIILEVYKQFPQVYCIENNKNVGFSKANNQGIKVAKGRYILLLNSDTVIEETTLETMIDFMDSNPNIGASGCKVVLPNGTLDKACRRGFPTPTASFYYFSGLAKRYPNNPKYNQYHLGHLNEDEVYPVDCLVGAFMLVRKEVIDEVGGLDEDFFMYGEDIDWCYRIKQGGWENYYYPMTTIIHYKGASSRRKPYKIIYEFHRAMYLFHRKHFSRKYSFMTNTVVYLGITTKLLISLIRKK